MGLKFYDIKAVKDAADGSNVKDIFIASLADYKPVVILKSGIKKYIKLCIETYPDYKKSLKELEKKLLS